MSTASKLRHYRPDIDGLRAYSVLAVILFHAEFELFSGGFVGVDVFFVISGYLITGLLVNEIEAGTFRFGNFYMRRARRLFPALFFVAALSFVLAFAMFSPAHLERFGGALLYTMASLSNVFFWGEEGYFDSAAHFKPLLHTWSLSVEEQFYLLWPALMVMLTRRFSSSATALAIAGLAGLSLFYSERLIDGDATAAFFLTPFRLFELALGGLLVWLSRFQAKRVWLLEIYTVCGFGLIGYAVFGYDAQTPFPGLNALLPCLGAALIICAGGAPYTGVLLRNPVAVRIGLISYSLYLVHWPVLVFYRYYTYQDPGTAERIALIAFSIGAAAFMYRFVERPFRRGHLQTGALSAPAFGLVCALAVILISLPAATAWARGGWSWRLSATTVPSELVHAYTTWSPAWAAKEPRYRPRFRAITGVGSRKPDAAQGLIIGDSHANHFAHLADYIGKKHNIRFVIYMGFGCPPVFDTWKVYAINNTREGRERQAACKQQVERWEQLITARRFDYVGLASRWAWLYEDDRYGPYRMRQDFLVTNENDAHDQASSRAVFSKYLPLSVDRIRATGAQVLLFSQVPHQGKTVDECSSVPGYIFNAQDIGKRCGGIDRALALKRLAFTDQTMRALARREGVHALIPSDHFCPQGQRHCTAYIGTTGLYQNNNHINKYGAIFLARSWEKSPDFPWSAPVTRGSASRASNASRPP